MTDLHTAIERLNRFAQTFNDEDEVDEESGLTGADLKEIVRHAQAGQVEE